jgi:hypothetical protein
MRKQWMRAAVVLGVVIACVTSPGCRRRGHEVPEVLLGVWTSSSPGYSDRYIDIRPDAIIFGTGGTTSRGYRILGCERRVTPDGPLYILEFTGVSSGPYRRPLYYISKGRGQLKFKNEPAVTWVRSS